MNFKKLTGVLLVGAAFFAPHAAAVTYEPKPSDFCNGEVVRDYLKPLERMPKLHAPPSSGRLGFGPKNLLLSVNPRLQVGSGSIGYWLYLRQRKPVRLDWTVTTLFTPVNGAGQPIGRERRRIRSLRTLDPFGGPRIGVKVPEKPAFYRLTAVFHRASGQKLGGFGAYFRVVRPTRHARLATNSTSYRPEQTVFGRVENLGTLSAFYGVEHSIERLEAGTWSEAPESPKGPWILPLLISGPGLSGVCNGFWIPPSMPPGRYRMVKEVGIGEWRGRDPAAERILTAEFDVVP